MRLRATRTAVAPTRLWAFLVLAAAGASALIAGLPTLATQVALLLGAAVSTAAVMMTRAGRVLNPAWVIVVALYLVGPVGTLSRQAGIGLSMLAVVVLVFSPFVLAALVIHPQTRGRLLLLTPLVLLALLAALSLVWSPNPSYGLDKLTVWILTGLLPAAFILVLASGSRGVSWALIAAAALISALALIAFGVETSLYPGRPTLFDANPIWAARAAFIGALVAIFGPFPTPAKLVMAPVMIVAGLLTVSLGPTIGLLVGAWAGAAEALRCADRTDRRVAVGWAVLGFGTGLILLVALTLGSEIDTGSRIVAGVVADPNVTSRASFLGASGSLFLRAPMLGIGVGGFSVSGLDVYPHNLIAEVGVELGLTGIIAFLAWLGLALRGAARSPILVALVVGTGVYALFSGSLASNTEFWMFSALAIAMVPVGHQRVMRADRAADQPPGGAADQPPGSASDQPSGRAAGQ